MNLSEIAKKRLAETLPSVKLMLSQEKLSVRESAPPQSNGVYIFYDESGEVSYVGQASGAKGLKDRIKSKHVSGDDRHALQRAFVDRFPDRSERREYIKDNLTVSWIEIEDINIIGHTEHFLIWLFQPKWNRQ